MNLDQCFFCKSHKIIMGLPYFLFWGVNVHFLTTFFSDKTITVQHLYEKLSEDEFMEDKTKILSFSCEYNSTRSIGSETAV